MHKCVLIPVYPQRTVCIKFEKCKINPFNDYPHYHSPKKNPKNITINIIYVRCCWDTHQLQENIKQGIGEFRTVLCWMFIWNSFFLGRPLLAVLNNVFKAKIYCLKKRNTFSSSICVRETSLLETITNNNRPQT